MKTTRFTSAALLVIVLGGCASGGARSSWRLPGGQRCERLAPDEERLPVAALLSGGDAVPLARPLADTALLVVGYDSAGALAAVDVYARGLAEAEKEAAEARVRELFVPAAAPLAHAWGLVLPGEPARLAPLDPEYRCEPLMTNREELIRTLQDLAERPVLLNRSLLVVARVEMDGTVREARIQQGTGIPAVDVVLAKVALEAEFLPGLLHGYPIPVWVRFPLGIGSP